MQIFIRNKALYTILFILILFSFSIHPAISQDRTGKISILFMGDIMGHDEQIWSAENRQTHTFDYNEVFSYVKPIISDADIAIANLEVTLAGQPYMGYPQFSSPAELAVACKNAGIDYLGTANNHSADRGKSGILNTILRLDSLEIEHTGTFVNSAMRDSLSPLMINKNGGAIALLNYTYGTNGLKVPDPVIVNMLDKDLITKDILKARNKNADLIILFIHWGTEYDTVPSKHQADLAEYFFSQGADLIIGSHPHVLQKMNRLNNDSTGREGVVVYSLGNFVSNQRKPKTDGGSMVRIELTWTDNELKITDAGYYLTWVYTPVVNYRKKFYILPCTEFENKPDFFKNQSDYSQLKKFITGSRTLLNKQNLSIDEIIYKGEMIQSD
jgi:poly-gamma-glutamate synthesis protein (capsule biosynthesis protein)